MYSSGVIVRSPSSTTSTPSRTFASASSRVGSSRWSPLMNTTSASAIACASDGAGSNVWLFVPSGTIPVTSTRSPATFWTMFVIGETVVTTWRGPSSFAAGRLARAGRADERERHEPAASESLGPRSHGVEDIATCNRLQQTGDAVGRTGRSVAACLEARRLGVLPEDAAQGVHDLALGALGSGAIDERLDEVGVRPGELDQPVERCPRGAGVPAGAHRAHPLDLRRLGPRRDLQRCPRPPHPPRRSRSRRP